MGFIILCIYIYTFLDFYLWKIRKFQRISYVLFNLYTISIFYWWSGNEIAIDQRNVPTNWEERKIQKLNIKGFDNWLNLEAIYSVNINYFKFCQE